MFRHLWTIFLLTILHTLFFLNFLSSAIPMIFSLSIFPPIAISPWTFSSLMSKLDPLSPLAKLMMTLRGVTLWLPQSENIG